MRARILGGEFSVGAKLPPHTELAAEFGISPVTMRRALARLSAEGLVDGKPGRGTVVLERTAPAVLIVEDDLAGRALLHEHVTRAGRRALEAADPDEALALLERDPSIMLVLSDIRMPTPEPGIAFIRTVRRRWPDLPLIAVTAYPSDLAALHGSPEWPVLIIPKPFHARQIHEALRFAFGRTPREPAVASSARPTEGPGRR